MSRSADAALSAFIGSVCSPSLDRVLPSTAHSPHSRYLGTRDQTFATDSYGAAWSIMYRRDRCS